MVTLNTAARAARARESFDHRCEVLRDSLQDRDFLGNKGLGNEIGFHVFCYDPSLEFEMRDLVGRIEHESERGQLPCRIKQVNLYDALLTICEQKRILPAIPKQEFKTGTKRQIEQLKKVCSPAAFASCILEQTLPHEPGDVIVITGVGEVFPLLRVHDLFNNMLAEFDRVPVIAMFPGSYNGQSFRLFNQLSADSYYRALAID